MAKIFQIRNGFCFWDATSKFPTIESTFGKFSDEIKFVAAPDYVFEGWGYDETSADPWIKPTAPEGWLYDDATGTFYLENPPEELKPVEQRITDIQTALSDIDAINVDQEYRLTLLELGITEEETA